MSHPTWRQPPDVNPREDRYDAALPEYGVPFLRERVFQVLYDGLMHEHRDQSQVLVVLEGRLALGLEGARRRLSVGEACMLPPAVPHFLAAGGSDEQVTLLDLRVTSGAHHDLGRLIEALPAARPLVLSRPALDRASAELAAAACSAGWRRAPRVLSALWRLVAALELKEGAVPQAGQPNLSDYRLRRAEAFIAQNLADEIGVDEIAAAAGLSRSQLTRLYRQALSVTPAARLRDCRIHAARRLLASGRLSVKEVARAVGFRWVHHFTRTYRAQRGRTPALDLGVDE